MTREEIERLAEESGLDGVVLADGFEDSFVGFAERCGSGPVAVYDFDNAVKSLTERSLMSEDAACEYLHFNVLGAYAGDQTPWFITVKT